MPNDSTMKFRADISQLKAAMQEASRAIKVANSEFKAATAGMDKWGSSATGLEAKLKQLNTVLKAQKTQLSLAEQELEKTRKVYGENSAETDRARIKVNNYKAAIGKTEKDLSKYEQELEKVGNESEDMGNAVEDSARAAEKAGDGFTVMKGALASLVADGIRLAVGAVKDLARETFNAGANFESAMSQVEAVSGASASEMDALTAKAKEMGETTKFSASESAEAFNYMAMAGWKTEDMIGGIAGIMNLAAASGEDLATTSDIVTDALTAMGYSAKDSGQLADVMAAASSNANTNVKLMGDTFQYAAPLVGALGYNMEDTAVAIGLMANAGIKGQKAGTALRSILTRLASPPKAASEAMEKLGINLKDASGKMKPFSEVIKDMREKFSGLSETQQAQMASAIGGQEAMSGLLAIVNAAPSDFEKLTKAVANSEGAAKDMSDTMNDNVSGQITLLKSKIEGIMIKVFEKAAPRIRKAIDSISSALDGVDWNGVADRVGSAMQKVVGVFTYVLKNGRTIATILGVIGTALASVFVVNKISAFVTSITNLTGTFGKLKTAIAASETASKGLALAQKAIPLVALASGIAAVVGAMIKWQNSHDAAIRKTQSLTAEQKKLIEETKAETQAYNEADKARKEANNGISSEYGYIEQLKNEYNGLIGKNGEVKEKYKDRANFIIGELANALGLERDEIQKLINKNGKLGESIDKLIEKKKAEAMLSANEDAYKEAISKQGEALKNYQDNLSELETVAKKRSEAGKALKKAEEAYLAAPVEMKDDAAETWNDAKTAYAEADKNYKKLEKSAKDAENTYIGYQATIQNYEGLSTAIINGDSKKIATALTNMQNNFITAKNGTKATLQQQVKDYQSNYESLKKAVESGMPGVTQAQVKAAKDMVDKAKKELNKLPPEGKKTGKKSGDEHAKGVESTTGKNKSAGRKAGKAATTGEKEGGKNSKKNGKKQGEDHAKGVESTKGKNKKAGEKVGKAGVQGEKDGSKGSGKAGSKAGDDYADSLGNKKEKAGKKAEKVGEHAKSSLEVDTTSSGENFLQGFIDSLSPKSSIVGTLMSAVTGVGSKILKWFNDSLGEKSPSKLTFKSGKYFVQGFVNGVAKSQKTLVKTVQDLAGLAVKEMAKMSGFNFSEVASNASTKFADGMAKQVDYMLAKMNYKNEQKIKEFDSKISSLESKRDKKVSALEKARDKKVAALEKKKDKAKKDEDKKAIQKEIDKVKKNYNKQISATKSQYNKLIKTQEKYKEAYSTASAQMISDFQNALSEYQAKAQALIDDVINGITDKYNERYDELINKQDSLIEKLKSSVELFEISGAGVITIGDIKEQTKEINDYYNKLAEIKGKVSSELFDQITSYDMAEGSAFVTQLLNMSAADLKAYDKAYTQMLKAANKAGTNIYKDDFEQLEKDYQEELDKAFKNIEKKLKKLGEQAMKGFVNGLTKNTNYMNKNVKTFVKSLIARFKKELGIKSPSKVMAEIGEYTGEGFDNGLLSVVKNIQKTAGEIASAVSTPLSNVTADIGGVGATVAQGGINGVGGGNVVNNYNLVQNNTSPKALTALETYKARRRQISMLKAATQNG